MRIKGTTNPSCALCSHAHFDQKNEQLLCMLTHEETDKDFTCKKFRYDIYKYEATKKFTFEKFSQKDFEL